MNSRIIIKSNKGSITLQGNTAGLTVLRNIIDSTLLLKEEKVQLILHGPQDLQLDVTDIERREKGPRYEGPLTIEDLRRRPVTRDFDTDNYITRIRKTYRRAYEPWTEDEDKLLIKRWYALDGLHWNKIKSLAITFQRQPGAISSRLTKKFGISHPGIGGKV